MRRNAIHAGLSLIAVAMFLGATLFREEVAQAASAILNVQEQNTDANGNIKVHEQGTATVNVSNTVATDDKFAPGMEPARFGPVELDQGDIFGTPVVPAVPAGKTFIVTYLNVEGLSMGVACLLYLRVSSGGSTVTSHLGSLPVQANAGLTVGSEEAFIPLKAGEGVNVACSGAGLVRALVAGYFVPAT
jgi:hypothetical protein